MVIREGWVVEGWKTRLEECACNLLWINDYFRVREFELYGCFELFSFPYYSKVDILFKVLMCRSVVPLKCGKGKPYLPIKRKC
jgi:hypothetical protein